MRVVPMIPPPDVTTRRAFEEAARIDTAAAALFAFCEPRNGLTWRELAPEKQDRYRASVKLEAALLSRGTDALLAGHFAADAAVQTGLEMGTTAKPFDALTPTQRFALAMQWRDGWLQARRLMGAQDPETEARLRRQFAADLPQLTQGERE